MKIQIKDKTHEFEILKVDKVEIGFARVSGKLDNKPFSTVISLSHERDMENVIKLRVKNNILSKNKKSILEIRHDKNFDEVKKLIGT